VLLDEAVDGCLQLHDRAEYAALRKRLV
jgi:hypothetical protein